MLLDLALVLPSIGPRSSDAAGEPVAADASDDPFAALLAALFQPAAVPPAPSPPPDDRAAPPPIPALLPPPAEGESMVGPIPPPQPEPPPPGESGRERTSAMQHGAVGPLPVADEGAPPPLPPEPPAQAPRVRADAIEAAIPRPALAAAARGAQPQPSSSGITTQPSSVPPQPEAAGGLPLLRQDGGAGPPLEARLAPLIALSKPAPAAGASPDARPPALQIALQIAQAAPHRIEQMRVQLHPAALGQVEIRLEFGEQGRVRALIAVERPETLEVLQRDAPALERSLHDAGLRTDPGALSFSLRRDREAWAQGEPRVGSAERAAGAGSGEVEPDPPAWRSGRHLIDVHV